MPYPIRAARQRNRLEHGLKPLAFAFLHFLKFLRIGKISQPLSAEQLGLLLQLPGARGR
jgi:hypothetical protein